MPTDRDVTAAERRVLTALARAAVDPGELLWRELFVRVRPTPFEVLVKVVRDLEADGWLEVEGDSMQDAVRLTADGGALVNALNIAWAVRT